MMARVRRPVPKQIVDEDVDRRTGKVTRVPRPPSETERRDFSRADAVRAVREFDFDGWEGDPIVAELGRVVQLLLDE